MKKHLLTLTFLLFLSGMCYSAGIEDVYVLNEGFESGVFPEGWTQEYVNSDLYGEHPWVVESAATAEYPTGAAGGSQYRIALRNETSASIGFTTRLISPVLDLSIGKVFQPILVFSHAQQQRTGDFDQLKVYYRTSAESRWVRIDDDKFNKKIPKWTNDTISLTAQSSTYQVMFEATDNFGRGVVLDNIQVRPMPTCVDPHDFTTSSVTTNAATIGWQASFDTDSFEVVLSTAEIEDMEDIEVGNIVYYGFLKDDNFSFSTSDVNVTLSRGKTYYFYVRAYCQGAMSEWSGTRFRTKNIVNLPYSATFTPGQGWEYKTNSINHISNWTFGTSIKKDDGVTMEYMPFVNTGTEPNTATSGYYAYDGGFCLAFTGARVLESDIPAGQYVYCATPEINVEDLKKVVISFWGTAYKSVSDDYASGIIVGVMTDPENFATFQPVDTCYIKKTETFDKFGVSLASYSGEGKYIAFASDFKQKKNRFYIDNISIKASSAPIWPSDIQIKNVSAKGFDLSLNSHGNAYNVIVSKRVTDQVGDIMYDPTAANYGVENYIVTLQNQTAQELKVDIPVEYAGQLIEIYVQGVGSDGAVSEWSLPATTRLPMYLGAAQMPYKIDWEETATWQERQLYPFGSNGTSTNWPNEVITMTLTAPNYYGQNRSYASRNTWSSSDKTQSTMENKSGSHWVQLKKEFNEVTKGDPELYGFRHQYGNYIALPEVEDVKNVLLKFYMERYSSTVENSSRVAVGVMTDPYDISTFETIATFDCNSYEEYKPFSCSFENYAGSGKIIAIQAVDAEQSYTSGSTSSGNYAWNSGYTSNQRLDWIYLFALGACNPIANPKVEATHESAVISWGANGMNAWIVRIKDEKGVMVDSVKVETNSYTINGLQPHATYTYMVSPLCDTDYELSDWLTFTTECLPGEKLPFVEDFENPDYITGSSKYWIPYCWSAPSYSFTESHGGESSTSYYPYISRSTTANWGHASNSMFALYSNSQSSAQRQIWLALPQMEAKIDTLQMEFYVKGYSISQNSMLQVGVMTDPSDLNTFEVVDSVNVVGTAWQGVVVKFDKYKGQGKYLAFKRNYERDKYAQHYLDDIVVNYISDCQKIFVVNTSAPNVSGAKFDWANVGADKYEVLVTSKSVNPETGDTAGIVVDVIEVDTNSLVYQNDKLELNTNYYVHVRSVCGLTKTSWSDEAVFKTTCLPQTAEGYGTLTFTDANSLGCWSVGINSGSNNKPSRAGSATGKFGWYLYLYTATGSDGSYAIMPPLDVDDITKYQMSLDICHNNTSATNVNRVTVGIISNAADLSTFAPVTVVKDFPYATDSLGMMRVTIPFDKYDGDLVTGAKGNQVMFLTETGDSAVWAYIDNIKFELIPDCAAPSTVVADSVGTYGAKIAWNKTGEKYEVAITETKVAPGEADAKVVWQKETTDTFAIANDTLEMLTTYYMYVRTICGEGDTSAWSHARQFTTICPEYYTLPFSQDFESCANTGASYKPDCWTYYYVSGANVTEGKSASYPTITAASYSHNSQKSMYMYSSNATNKIYSYAATPYINTELNKAMVSFWYRANAYAAATPTRKLVVGIAEEVSTLDTLMATLTVLDTIVQTNTSSTIPYEKYTCIVSEKYTGKGHYVVLIGLEGNGATSTGGMYVDDIEITLVPTCFTPDNLKVVKTYDTEAQLTWEQLQGDNNAWEVAYGQKDAEPTAMTIVAADKPEMTITGLQPGTEYDFYVRANCGGGEVSEWRGPVTASTLYQVALADAKWTFENGEIQVAQAPTGSNKKPVSWFVNNVHTGLNTVANAPYITYNTKNATTGLNSANKAYSGDSAMYFYSGTTTGLTGYGPYAALPVIKDADYDSLQVRFMARVTYSNTPSKVDGRDSMMYTTYAYEGGSYKRTMYVGVATDPYDMSTFEELTQYVLPTLGTSSTAVNINKVPDPEGTNYWREVVVPLYGAKGKYIILAGAGTYNTVFVDDVKVEKLDPNACANVTKLAMDEDALKYNAAAFSWLSPKTQFVVNITDAETGVAVVANQQVTASEFSTTALEEQTEYIFSVQAVCGEGLSKAVTLNFTTPCMPTDEEDAMWNFAEDLYQWGTSATYVIPECWDEGLGYGSSASYTPYAIVNTNSYAYGKGDVTDRALRFYTTASYYNAYAVLPEMSFSLDSMTLHFWGRAAYFYGSWYTTASTRNRLYSANGNYSRALIVGTMTDASDFSTFTPIDTITYDHKWTSTTGVFAYNDESGNDYWQEYALPLAKYAGKGRIAIVAPNPKDFSTASSPTSYFFVDDLEIIKGDFCTPVTGQGVTDINSNSATISWSAPITNNNVQLMVATNDNFEDKSVVFNQTITDKSSMKVDNLKPSTKYYYTLKHICDAEAGDESDWSTAGEFMTDYVIRFNENFDEVNTTIPRNWSRSISAAAADVFAGTKVLSEASATATYAWRTNVDADRQIYANTTSNSGISSSDSQYHWLITPILDLAKNAEDSILLSFDVALRGQTTIVPNANTDLLEQFMVVVSEDEGATWKKENATIWSTDEDGDFDFAELYANGEFLTKYIDMTKYAGKSVKIAFYIGSYANKGVVKSRNYIYLDNIQLNTYTLTSNSDNICRWEDYSGYNFEIDADLLPAGENNFERFVPAKKDGVADEIHRLKVNVTDESVSDMETVVLCEGETFNNYNFNFVAGQSGVYKQKLQSAVGCDSTVILNVVVNPRLYADEVQTICQGAYYEFNGEKYYTSTEHTDTLSSVVTGCDSIVTLHLTVNEILKGEPEVVYLCPDQTYDFTAKYMGISEEGIYTDTIQNSKNCDSIASVQIKKAEPAHVLIHAAICQGDIYDEGIFSGLRSSGIYETKKGILHTVHGCDSIVTLHLLVAREGTMADSTKVDELPYVLNGVEILPAGTAEGVYTEDVNMPCGHTTLVITVGTPSGLSTVFANSLALAPNPVRTGETVKVLSSFSAAQVADMTVEVYDGTGALVSRKAPKVAPVTIDPLPAAGVYMVRIVTGGETYQAKLVVK